VADVPVGETDPRLEVGGREEPPVEKGSPDVWGVGGQRVDEVLPDRALAARPRPLAER
jgi:hypothetical protein